MKKDIYIYYAFSFLLGFYIANGTTVLFERVLNFSYSQVFTLGAVYMLMFILFEIPSGALADLIGRKKCIALGCLLLTAAAIASGISNTFVQLFFSFFLWAMGFSCISGANEALLYDRVNNEEIYGKVLGKSLLLGLVGTTLAGVLGPWLFSHNFRFPYFFSAIPFFLGGLIILFFYEAKIEGKFTIRQHLMQMWSASHTAFGNKFIRWAGLFLALIFAISYTMSNAYQPYLQNIGFNVKAFSVILPAMFLFGGFGSMASRKLYDYLGENKLFIVTLLLLALSLGLLGLFAVKFALIALFLYSFIQGIASPLISTYSNRYIASHERATVLSVQSMVSTVAASLPLFLFGFLTDKFGLNNLLITLGSIILIAGIALIITKPKAA